VVGEHGTTASLSKIFRHRDAPFRQAIATYLREGIEKDEISRSADADADADADPDAATLLVVGRLRGDALQLMLDSGAAGAQELCGQARQMVRASLQTPAEDTEKERGRMNPTARHQRLEASPGARA